MRLSCSLSLPGAIGVALVCSSLAAAYIPAIATNDQSLIVHSDDTIHISWLPNGIFSAKLSRQLTADPPEADNSTVPGDTVESIVASSKYAKGVLLHFSEAQTNEPPSLVPWIAMISCDTNGTDYSIELDIFTLARDRGAQAALLYTVNQAACVINPEYLTPNFDKVLDIYTTGQAQDAIIIEHQFAPGFNIDSEGYNFSSQSLNASAATVEQLLSSPLLYIEGDYIVTSIVSDTTTFLSTVSTNTAAGDGYPTTTASSDPDQAATSTSSFPSLYGPTSAARAKRAATSTSKSATPTASSSLAPVRYLAAVMAATNNTVGGNGTTNAASPSATSSSNAPNTGLAMIILYAITGVVTFMFLIVILSGAIRAIRHPERYGPRAALTRTGGGNSRAPQSRAGGLTRAILDTFPVVKFGRSTEAEVREDDEAPKEVELDRMSKEEIMTVVAPAVAESERSDDKNRDSKASGSRHSLEDDEPPPTTGVVPPTTASALLPPSTSTSSSEPLSLDPSPPSDAPQPLPSATINPADVDSGTTCPICVCEFEEGEDVRILPCDGRHRFHRDCIDPWLLQVSSLCPLCRLDLSGPKDVVPAIPADEDEAVGEERVIGNLRAMLHGHRGSNSSGGMAGARDSTGGTAAGSRNRFFRYVANRRRVVGRQEEQPVTAATPP